MNDTYLTVSLCQAHNTLQRLDMVIGLGWPMASTEIEPGSIVFLVFALVSLIFASSSRR